MACFMPGVGKDKAKLNKRRRMVVETEVANASSAHGQKAGTTARNEGATALSAPAGCPGCGRGSSTVLDSGCWMWMSMSQKRPMETRGPSLPLAAAGRASCPVKISASGPAAHRGDPWRAQGQGQRDGLRASSFELRCAVDDFPYASCNLGGVLVVGWPVAGVHLNCVLVLVLRRWSAVKTASSSSSAAAIGASLGKDRETTSRPVSSHTSDMAPHQFVVQTDGVCM
jgi:hypothetical protein